MGRLPSTNSGNNELKKGPWTPEEDQKLIDYIQKNGQGSWQLLPKRAGINRCGKSCRLRWTNYLRPDIKRGNFSPEEEQTIIDLHSILGNKWSMIATHLPGRTDNEIKNFWNTHLRKKLLQSGIDPQTHQPITDPLNLLLMNLPPMLPTQNLNSLMENPHHPLENFAKVRLLYDILLILKTNPIPNFLGVSSQNLNQFEEPNTGILNPNNISSTLPNLEYIDTSCSDFQPVSDNFVTIPGFAYAENKGIISNNSSTISQFSLPALLSRELCSDNQVRCVDYSGNVPNYEQMVASSNNADTWWGALKGDEASTSSFWKDIFIE